MDNQTIEILSISAVRDSIAISGFLSPYIADNDKEPTWDGRIYIYDDKSKKKSKMRGYVSVQVKGKEYNGLSKDEITYPVSTVDMKNFLYDGGAVFFVVYISSDGIQKKIYYTTLSPVKLKLYLKDTKEQKTKSLKFNLFPDDNNRKANIFLSFFVDSKKQTSFATTGILSLEELENQGSLQGLTFSVTGYGYSQANIYEALFENEIYMYADIKGSSVPIPIDLIPENIHTQEVVPNIVSVNAKVYYNKITRIRSKNKTVTKIGDSFLITYSDGSNQINIKYNLAPMLRDRVKDTEFFIDALKSKHFYINGMRLDLNPTNEEMQSINLERQGETLDYFKKMLSVLDILNVDQDINIVKMSEQERREMHNLIVAFAEKTPVSNLKKDLPVVCRLKIQDILLLLVFEKCKDDKEGTYNIYNFFRSNLVIYYDIENSDEKYLTSQYSILQKDDYLHISNIDYDAILQSYQALLKENPKIYDRANNDMLTMLSAYDEIGEKNKKLLKIAKDFAEWILNEDKDEVLSYEIKLLNYLQIIRRERELNIDEVRQLCSITEDNSRGEDIKTAAHLLLGNQLVAEIHFEKIETEVQEGFKKYPIYKFWNKIVEDKING